MAPIITLKNGLQNFHVLRFSLNVPGLGLTWQLFSMSDVFILFAANLIKENIKSHWYHLNLFSDTKFIYICTKKN